MAKTQGMRPFQQALAVVLSEMQVRRAEHANARSANGQPLLALPHTRPAGATAQAIPHAALKPHTAMARGGAHGGAHRQVHALHRCRPVRGVVF